MYVWGDPRICSSMVLTLIGTLFSLMVVISYQEQTKQLHVLRWFVIFKRNAIKYKLDKKLYDRLNRRTTILIKYFVKPGSLFLVLCFEYIVIHSTYLAYTDPNTNYSLIGSLFSLFLLTIVILQGAGVALALLLLYFIIIQVTVMKFNEVHNKIVKLLNNYKNNTFQLALLVSILHEHNYFAKMTMEANVTVKWVLFVIYYIATPALQISIYCVHHRATHPICRIFCAVIVIALSVLLFIPVVLSTWITKSANRPNRYLQSFVGRNVDNKVPIRMRLQIMNFIERLFGADIAFHCLDLFPMNNYEFYQYLYIAGLNYILMMSLI